MSRRPFSFDHIGLGALTVVLVDGTILSGSLVQSPLRHHHDDEPRPIPVNVVGDVEIEPEFILLSLTAPFPSTGTVIFPINTVVAINDNQILFAGPVSIT